MERTDLEGEIGMLFELWAETAIALENLKSALFLQTTPAVERRVLETWQWLRGGPLQNADG